MHSYALIGYMLLCLMVALLGRKSKPGFFRTLVFSIMLTPLVMMLYLLIFTNLQAESRRE